MHFMQNKTGNFRQLGTGHQNSWLNIPHTKKNQQLTGHNEVLFQKVDE